MRRDLLLALAVFAVALALRLLYLGQIADAVVFDLPMGDGLRYHRWAQQISAGNWLGDQVFYQAPLYPYVLAVQYATVGESWLMVRLVQMLLGSAACALLTLAGIGFFDRRSGVLAGLMLACYPAAIFFDGLIQKSALDTFLLCSLLALVAWSPRRTTGALLALAGVTLGLLVLTRENALVLAPLLLGWIAWQFRERPWPRRGRLAAAFLLGMTLALLPVVARNAWVGGEFHLTTSQLGPNFYIGNGQGATGVYRALRYGRGDPQYEQRDAVELAELASGRTLSSGEVSRYWLTRALRDIADDPARWLRLLAHKAALLVNATEMVDTEDQYTYAEWSWLLRGLNPLWHLGVLLPLAVLGAVVQASRWRQAALLYALIAVYAASVIAFYVMARYRFPLAPPLMLIAGWGVADLTRWNWRAPLPWSRLGPALVAAAFAAILCNWPIHDRDMMRATTHYAIAVHLSERDGPSTEAIAHLRRAMALRPGHSAPRLALAQMLAQRGDEAEAAAVYRDLLIEHPRHVVALVQFARLLLEAQDPKVRNPQTALQVAQQAQTLTGGRDAAINALVQQARVAAEPR